MTFLQNDGIREYLVQEKSPNAGKQRVIFRPIFQVATQKRWIHSWITDSDSELQSGVPLNMCYKHNATIQGGLWYHNFWFLKHLLDLHRISSRISWSQEALKEKGRTKEKGKKCLECLKFLEMFHTIFTRHCYLFAYRTVICICNCLARLSFVLKTFPMVQIVR